MFLRKLFFTFFFSLSLFAKTIDTFYGPIEVEEAVLLELIESAPFQRLKDIHQYGICYYTTHREEYSRYDHSLGVFTILRKNKFPLKTQIAGLLHDVSHTAFSHVSEWVFRQGNHSVSNHEDLHESFLKESGLEKILVRYGFKGSELLPALFPALDCPLPYLCADRIDYNLQGAFHQGFLTRKEIDEIVHNDLQYVDGKWISQRPDLMKKLAKFSLFMTKDCWGSPVNHMLSVWFSDAILRAIELGSLSFRDFCSGTDQTIWDLLTKHKDKKIKTLMHKVLNYKQYLFFADPTEAHLVIKSKFRGLNPLVQTNSGVSSLSSLDFDYAREFEETKILHKTGWGMSVLSPP